MDPEDSPVVLQLRRYLSDHPLACDSPDGIGRWWLRSSHPQAAVEQALAWLAARGELERLPAADGRVRWRRSSGFRGLT